MQQTAIRGNEGISVNGSEEIKYNMFQQLRPSKWLDSWTIAAAMHLSDKPAYVKHGLSVLLDEEGPNSQMQAKQRPLAGLAKTIFAFHEQIKASDGTVTPLMYYCPINHKNTHFSLLEIDVKQRTIRHYDSNMPPNAMVDGSRVKSLILEEFRKGNYSCGESVSVHPAKCEQSTNSRVSLLHSRKTAGAVAFAWSGISNA